MTTLRQRIGQALAALALAAGAFAAVAWFTDWLDPHVPGLHGWRQQARRSELGRHLAPASKPYWVTVAPGERASCLKKAGNELNDTYLQCRNGRRELVRDEPDGSRTLLQVQVMERTSVD